MTRSVCLLVLCGATVAAADKPNRDIQELQRDVAQLQDMMKNLQKSLDDRFTALASQVQKSADTAAQANDVVAAARKSIEQAVKDLHAPVMAINPRFDQIGNDLRTTQQAVGDLTSLMNKVQTQMSDMINEIKILNAPKPELPKEKPPISATDLITNAERDRMSGKFEIALSEYSDFLKWYGDTPQASTAQYYIGWTYYSQKDCDSAVNAFDAVLQKYPDAEKLPDALYMKSECLKSLGRASEAADAVKELTTRFPNSDLAKKSKSTKK